ncbi:MAG: nuclear transport factor 2 family protein, partial [Acetobacteraceae bacterium]|nr:nuclear transport factor 2 family protein [Acetobacteraceae bacterium]
AGLAALLAAMPLAARAQPAEQAAVAGAVERLTKAMVARDKAALEALSAPQLSYGHSAGRIENRQQFIDNVVGGASQFRFINLSEQTIEVSGNDAIVRHLFVAETQNREGQVTPVRIGVLQVWQKQGADWKLFARQAFRL